MTFHDLHRAELPLVLPNAWDVPSALAFRDAGFEAIGTTSFGVAVVTGQPDGARASRDANLVLAKQLSVLDCYVSVDIEDGYANEPAAVADYVAELAVDGVNIEDSTAEHLVDPKVHAEKVRAVKARTPDVFVNARVDTYWLGQQATPAATFERVQRYVDAGADGIFVPGLSDAAVITRLADRIAKPLNILAVSGTSLAELASWGVRRVSTGSLPYRAAIRAATDAAEAVRDGRAVPPAADYAELQAALVGYRRLPARD